MGECLDYDEAGGNDCCCEDEIGECLSCLYSDYPAYHFPCQNCRYRDYKEI